MNGKILFTVGDIVCAIEKRSPLWVNQPRNRGVSKIFWNEVSAELDRKRTQLREFAGFELKKLWDWFRHDYEEFLDHLEQSILYQDIDKYPEPEGYNPFALDFLDVQCPLEIIKEETLTGYDDHGEPEYAMSDDLSHETLDDSYMDQSEEDSRNEHQNSIPSLAKVGIVNEYLTKGTLNDVHKAIASDDLGQNQSQNIHGVDMVATNSNGQLEKDDVGTSRVEDTSRPEENGENLERKDGCLSPEGRGQSGIVDDNEMEVENAVEVPIENALDSQENQLKLRTPSKMQEALTKNPIGIPEDGGKFSEEEKRYQMVTSSLQSRRAEEKKTANKRHPPCRRRPIRKCLFPYDI